MNREKVELKSSTVSRFLKSIDYSNGCWIWKAYTLNRKWSKYGIITMNRKQYRSHRFSWMVFNGNIPKDMSVLHKCDNMRCVNPFHLFLGTIKDNNEDRDKKGRNVSPIGSRNGKSKLDEKKVKVIKQRLNRGLSYAEIGRYFNVRWQTIQAIAKGITWKHV